MRGHNSRERFFFQIDINPLPSLEDVTSNELIEDEEHD